MLTAAVVRPRVAVVIGADDQGVHGPIVAARPGGRAGRLTPSLLLDTLPDSIRLPRKMRHTNTTETWKLQNLTSVAHLLHLHGRD